MGEVTSGMRFIGIRGKGAVDRGIGSSTGARKFVQANTGKAGFKLPDLGKLLGGGKGMPNPNDDNKE